MQRELTWLEEAALVTRNYTRHLIVLPAHARLGRVVNPTLYTVDEFAQRVRDGKSFMLRVLEQPKIFVKGTEHDLTRLGGVGEPGAHQRA